MHNIILALPKPTDGGGGGGGEDAATGGGLTKMLPFLLVIVVVMLFMPLFSRKERTRQKRLKDVKKHDRVVTSGGIYGTVVGMDEHTINLEISKGVRITIKRSSVFDIETPTEAKEKAALEKKAGAKSA